MKNYKYFLILFLFIPVISLSQETLKGVHGLSYKGDNYYEFAGYEISTASLKKKSLDKAGLNSLKKKFKLKNITDEYTVSDIAVPNHVFVSESELEDKNSIKITRICYALPINENELNAICFQTCNARDTIVEKKFIAAYLNNELDKYTQPCCVADSIDFVGRIIHLGSACRWKSPNNVSCLGGQFSWSEFDTMEDAISDAKNRINSNDNNYSYPILDEDIDIYIEDVPSVARRIVYIPLFSGHYNYYNRYLIVYYVVEKIRDRYVSCILSNYGVNENDYYLSPLLSLIMQLENIPETAYNKFDIPSEYELTEEDRGNIKLRYKKQNNPYNLTVQAGLFMPIGELRNSVGISSAYMFKLGGGDRINGYRVDFGAGFAFGNDRKEFNFYGDNEVVQAKTSLFGLLGLWLGYDQKIANNIFLDRYIGLGVGFMDTNIEKPEKNKDGEKVNYSANTLHINAGLGIRWRMVGCFLEYNYAPYSIAGKVRRSFGSSFITMGVAVKL